MPETKNPASQSLPALTCVLVLFLACAGSGLAENLADKEQTKVSGKVESVRTDDQVVVLASEQGTIELLVVEETRIMVDGSAGALLDIPTGRKATATFVMMEQSGKDARVATTIEVR